MGLRGRERWVPAPATGMDSSPLGWVSQVNGLNGGTTVRTSLASHREYAMTWNANPRDALRPIMDMANGLHGTGLVYFIDPMAADKNVLPLQWAFPALASLDGPVLFGDTRPSTVPTASNSLDFPSLSAQYVPTTTLSSLYIPIPPGYTAWFGWHGSQDAPGGVQITTVQPGNLNGPVTLPTPIAMTDSTRVNTAFPSDSCQGIVVSFGGGTATNVTIAGMVCQILKTGSTPAVGPFISGQGHSGCTFNGKPSLQAISANVGQDGLVTMSAKLVEVSDWL